MDDRMRHLIVEALEHERGGVTIYRNALACAQDENLRDEFGTYLQQAQDHEAVLLQVCDDLDIDPELETPVRAIVRDTGQLLASSISKARKAGDPEIAELVACETVVLAETQNHAGWKLLSRIASALDPDEQRKLRNTPRRRNGMRSGKALRASAYPRSTL